MQDHAFNIETSSNEPPSMQSESGQPASDRPASDQPASDQHASQPSTEQALNSAIAAIEDATTRAGKFIQENATTVVLGTISVGLIAALAIKSRRTPESSVAHLEREIRRMAANPRKAGGDLADSVSTLINRAMTIDPKQLASYRATFDTWLEDAKKRLPASNS